MASLAQKDTSGTFLAGEDEVEVIEGRTRGFKKFRLPDAPDGRKRFRVGGQVGPIHYKSNPFSAVEQYKEIDLTIGAGHGCDLEMMANGYQIQAWHSRPNSVSAEEPLYVVRFLRAGHWVEVSPIALYYQNDLGQRQAVGALKGGVGATVDNDAYSVTYKGAFGPGLSLRYQLKPDEFYPVVEIASAAALPVPTIDPKGLRLVKLFSIRWDVDTDPVALTYADKLSPGELTLDASKFDSAPKVTQTAAFPAEAEVNVEARSERRQTWWWKPPRCWDSSEEAQDVPTLWEWAENHGQFAVAVSVAVADLGHVVYPVFLDTTPIGEEQVGASADDCAVTDQNVSIDLTATAHYIHNGTSSFNHSQEVGVRFTSVPIPKGATIDGATVSLYRANSSTTGPTQITLSGNDVAAADTFSTVGDFTGRAKTTANISPLPANWTAAVVDNYWVSPDAKAIVEEIVALVDWAEGAMAFLFNGPMGKNGQSFQMRTWNYAGNVSGPKFNASYTEGGGADVTVFPDALALTAAALAPIPTIISSPSALALTAALVGPEPVVTFTPSALALTAAVQAPTEVGTALVEPAEVTLTAAVLAPEPTVTVTPAALALSAALQVPTEVAGAVVEPTALSLTAAVQAPTTKAGAIVEPSALTMTASLPAAEPVVSTTPAALGLTIGVEAPEPTIVASPSTLALSAAVLAAEPVVVTTPAALALTAAVETATAVAGAVVEPAVVSLTAAVLAPEPTIVSTPATLPLTASVQAPTTTAGAVTEPAALALTAAILAPEPVITVSPSSLALTLALLDPEATVVVTPAALALALGLEAPEPVIIAHATALALSLGLPVPIIIATGSVVVLPAALALTLGLLAPEPVVSVQPAALALTGAVQAPNPTVIVTPDALALALNLEMPSLIAGAVVLPPALALTLGLETPAHAVIVTPAALPLVTTVESPTVTATAVVLPEALALTLGLLSPVVIVLAVSADVVGVAMSSDIFVGAEMSGDVSVGVDMSSDGFFTVQARPEAS